jgi:hypothetical protein
MTMKSPIPDQPLTEAEETAQTKNGYLALVSRLLLEEKLPIRFLYKTVPEHLNDTGWRMFTGYETEQFLQDEQTNMIPIPLERVCQIDPSLSELVAYNAGTVWERAPGAEGWERVYDFRIPTPRVEVEITHDVDQFVRKRSDA